MAHSVEGHLKLKIAEYDRLIRTLVYQYDAMRVVHLDILARTLPASGGLVLDLGGGTGDLAAAIAERFPQARIQVRDTDVGMLEFARERCAAFGDRIEYLAESFADPLPACDAVVACIALHHVKDMTAKGLIYQNIFAALRPGGVFANADTVMDSRPREREHYFALWRRWLQSHGHTAAEARQHHTNWAQEDYYPPLDTEIQLLRSAGFAEPDCFWRDEHQAVFGGIK